MTLLTIRFEIKPSEPTEDIRYRDAAYIPSVGDAINYSNSIVRYYVTDKDVYYSDEGKTAHIIVTCKPQKL